MQKFLAPALLLPNFFFSRTVPPDAFNSFMSVIKTLMLIQLCTGWYLAATPSATLPADTRVHKNAVATHVLSARLLCTLSYAAGRGPRI